MIIHATLDERFATASLTEEALPDLQARQYPRRTDSPVDASSPLAGAVEDIPPFGNVDRWAGLARDVPLPPPRRRRLPSPQPEPPGASSRRAWDEGFSVVSLPNPEGSIEEALPDRPYTPEPDRPDMPDATFRPGVFLEGLWINIQGYWNGIKTSERIQQFKGEARGFAETLGRVAETNRETPPDHRYRHAPMADPAHISGVAAQKGYRRGESKVYAYLNQMDALLQVDAETAGPAPALPVHGIPHVGPRDIR